MKNANSIGSCAHGSLLQRVGRLFPYLGTPPWRAGQRKGSAPLGRAALNAPEFLLRVMCAREQEFHPRDSQSRWTTFRGGRGGHMSHTWSIHFIIPIMKLWNHSPQTPSWTWYHETSGSPPAAAASAAMAASAAASAMCSSLSAVLAHERWGARPELERGRLCSKPALYRHWVARPPGRVRSVPADVPAHPSGVRRRPSCARRPLPPGCMHDGPGLGRAELSGLVSSLPKM